MGTVGAEARVRRGDRLCSQALGHFRVWATSEHGSPGQSRPSVLLSICLWICSSRNQNRRVSVCERCCGGALCCGLVPSTRRHRHPFISSHCLFTVAPFWSGGLNKGLSPPPTWASAGLSAPAFQPFWADPEWQLHHKELSPRTEAARLHCKKR